MGTCIAVLPAFGCASHPKRDPDQSGVLYDLGVRFYQERRIEAAVEQFNGALKADPENAEAYLMLGNIALNQGHDYIQQAETADCLQGRDAELVRQDATRKFREAEQRFRRAVELRPTLAEAWNNLAVAALSLQEWDAAITASEEALKNPGYASPEIARANLGWAFFQKKESQRAWKELHEAVARAPSFCVGRYRLAKVYVDRGDMEQAAENIEAVVNDNRCPIQEAFLLGGLVEKRRRDVVRARALFGRCAEMAPRSCLAAECRRYRELIQ
jgi:Tfp pilus assembly protein PilF